MNILTMVLMLIQIESGGNQNAIGDGGKAVGVLQIHPIMMLECNRILKRDEFTLNDRRDKTRSIAMAVTYLRHQRRRKPDATVAELMQSWQSGSIFKPCTDDYRRKVERSLTTTVTF